MTQDITSILKNLPSLPGVYRYYGIGDNVLYVGKAKNLKNRVSQYFQNNKLIDNPRLQTMVSQIERVEYTTVNTEKEALILEANLIYNLQPKYNVLLKDDRSYLYIRISNNQLKTQNLKLDNEFESHQTGVTTIDLNSTIDLSSLPKITLTRRKYDKNSDYFGPYTKKFGIVNVLRVLRSIFPFCEKVGAKADLTRESKACCQYFQLKQCDGICCGKETAEQYLNKIGQIKKVLSGETDSVKIWIKNKIGQAIAINNYELAGLWRDRLNLLDDVIANQQIVLPQPQDLDIISLIHEKDKSGLAIASVFIQNIREGKIINLNNFIMSGTENELEEEKEEIETGIKIKNQIENDNLIFKDDYSLDGNASKTENQNFSQQINFNLVDSLDLSDKIAIKLSSSNTQIQNFVQTFLVNYYSEQAYKPEILLQVYENAAKL
jgi:excinuclease ABC subunit C